MPLKNLPIKRKIITVILATTFTALVLSSIALLSYEFLSYRQTMSRTMDTMAEIIAANSAPALIFDDRKTAEDVLSGLRAEESIVAAALYDRTGRLYATYSPDGRPAASFPQTPLSDGSAFQARGFTLFRPAYQGSQRIGTLFIETNLDDLYNRFAIYGLVVLGVLLGTSVIAYLMSTVLQRQISLPLIALAETAKVVSERKDYSVRAVRRGDDEIGDLTAAFNTMLDRIQKTLSALGESEARLSAVFMQAGAGIAQNDLDGRFILVNDRFCEILGRSRQELLRLKMADVVEPLDWAAHGSSGKDRREDETLSAETAYVRPDGRTLWLRGRVAPIRSSTGVVESTLCVAEDNTARKEAIREMERARDAAERASRAKDDFVAALSHELRTPLNPVLLLASDAAINPELPDAIRADFETIRKNVELEARLIDDLLDLTRITRGKLILDKRPTDVGAVLRDAIDTVKGEVEEKQIRLNVVGGDENLRVLGDPVRLQQIFWNVLRNAVKFTPVGGSVTVTTTVPIPADRVRIEVTDTGIGLTSAELGTIFEQFAQGEHAQMPATQHRFGGMGLGLAISRMLVDLHDGSIMASSLGRDRGATFSIELPLMKAPVEAAPRPAEPPRAKPAAVPAVDPASATVAAKKDPGGRRLLLVDDHEPTRLALTQLLTARKYHVEGAGSVAQARELAGRESFDLLVSDIGLPDGNGYDLMADLHSRFGLKGIALSGYGMEQDIARSREAGFVSHLTKPVTVKSLEKALASAEAELGAGAPAR